VIGVGTGLTMHTLLQDLSERGLLDSTVVWWSGEFAQTVDLAAKSILATYASPNAARIPAGYKEQAVRLPSYQRGKTPPQPNHMEDWANCIQSRGTPKCSTDEAFIETATFLMSLVSQREGRVVHWDAAREEIV
jgi:hypothetical protein